MEIITLGVGATSTIPGNIRMGLVPEPAVITAGAFFIHNDLNLKERVRDLYQSLLEAFQAA